MKPSVEKLSLKFDIDLLLDHFEKHVRVLEPVYNGKTFHGWSVLSSTGSYRDGWVHGSSCFKIVNGESVFDHETARKIQLKNETRYDRPTEICHGYLAEVINQISNHGFHPCRARITCLPPRSHTDWHRDHRDGFYWVRMHIPLVTNPHCKFITEHDITHMPADGSAYLVNTAQMHMAINSGSEPRYNLIMQVWDTNGISANYPHGKREIALI